MGFANFHSRAATAAAQVLQGFDTTSFERLLERETVGVLFDGAAASSPDARATIELSVNLLARLYPRLAIIPLDRSARPHLERFAAIAHAINPNLTLYHSRRRLSSCIVIGSTSVDVSSHPVYVGSNGWLIHLSPEGPVGVASLAHQPLSAGAAACIGAANVFRRTFAEQLADGRADAPFTLSLFNYERDTDKQHPPLGRVRLDDAHLVGLGAIGNGTLWALSRLPALHGTLHVIDDETIELTNLQRYVLTRQDSIGRKKTDLTTQAFQDTEVNIVAHPSRWENYTTTHASWCFNEVAVAVDTPEDRIAIQAALPRWIVNAWTQPGDLGVSRHEFLGSQACLACLYLPDRQRPNEDELIAAAVGLSDALMEVRERLYKNTPVDRPLLERIAERTKVPVTELLRFEGESLRTFYTQAVCGGVIFKSTSGPRNIETPVPLPFQSALAGILLANDLVCHASGLQRDLPVRTSIDLLRPLGTYLSTAHAKPETKRCLCQDDDYIAIYREKYRN